MRQAIVLFTGLAIGIAGGQLAEGKEEPPDEGRDTNYWACHSVVYAAVAAISHTRDQPVCVRYRALATLSGFFDPGRSAEFTVPAIEDGWGVVSGSQRLAVGDKAVVVIFSGRQGEPGGYPVCSTRYMPHDHVEISYASGIPGDEPTPPVVVDSQYGAKDPVCIVKGIDDPLALSILGDIQERRKGLAEPSHTYAMFGAVKPADSPWDSMSVVYARAMGTSAGKLPGRSALVLRPIVKLSGEFDTGRAPEVVVPIDPRAANPDYALLGIAQPVLVVLVRTGTGYTILPDRAAFMPGDHSPIYTVKDFDDPKVKETLEAVQKLRHADDAKPKDEPADH